MEETCKILSHVGCLREKCLYTPVWCHICLHRVLPHMLSFFVIPGISSDSGTISKVLIPSRDGIPSSKEEKETMIIHRRVSLADFLA